MGKLRNIKIRTRMLLAFVFVSVLMICILLIAINDMRDTVERSDEVVTNVADPLSILVEARTILERGKVLGRDAVLLDDEAERDRQIDGIVTNISLVKELVGKFAETIQRAEAIVLYEEFVERIDKYDLDMRTLKEMLKAGEDVTDYINLTLSPNSDVLLDIMLQLNAIRLDLGREIINRTREATDDALVLLVTMSIIGVAASLVIGVLISISLSRPIMVGSELLLKVSKGDFTVEFPDNYGAEYGQFFTICNELMVFNRGSINSIRETSENMRKAAMSLMAISSDMDNNSKGLSEQTSSVNATVEEFSAGMTQSANTLSTVSTHISAVASSIEEINSTISTVAAAAEETSARAAQSSSLVESIQTSIQRASDSVDVVSNAFNSVADNVDEINKSIRVVSDHSVSAMNKVADADKKATNTNEIIQRLEAASKQINKIVGVISDIADQTNMLALNAAIEAAGAGEAGKGFMIVANEVKELAKQTAGATGEISDHIERMQKNMPEAVEAVQEITAIINGMTEYINSFANEIGQQGKLSDHISKESAEAARRMKELNTEIIRISENAQSVTRTVVDSTKGANEIAKSTAELVVGTQEIAMNSERASNNVREINRSAAEMASGLVDISRNISFINDEAGTVNKSASSTKEASEVILNMASEMEDSVKNLITG